MIPQQRPELPYEVEVVCPGPDHCLDDMCANSAVGLCGLPRREYDIWRDEADDVEEWDDDGEITDADNVPGQHA